MPATGLINSNPLPIHGPLWFDAREFGLSTKNADNAPALQAAHDAAAAAVAAWQAHDGSRTPLATVFIPGAKDPYVVKSPVFVDGTFIRFQGEGSGASHGSRIAMATGSAFPNFVVGLSRTAGGVVPNAIYRPDLWNGGSPKLDATAVSGAGRRWGLRTNGDLFVFSHGSSLSHGGISPTYGDQPSYWIEESCLTIDFAIEGFAAGKVPSGPLFGVGYNLFPSPYFVNSGGNGSFGITISYQTAKFGPATTSTYTFSAGSAVGVQRISIQVDLVNRVVLAWVNGTQVAVTGPPPPVGAMFLEVEDSTWVMNAVVNSGANVDFALYGLCVSRCPRYANNGVGTAQVVHPSIFNFGGGNATLFMSCAPTGGTYTITYGGQTTAPLAPNATPAQVQAALQALSTIGAGNVTVTGTAGVTYNIVSQNGFVFAGATGMCNGGNLTGATITDAYRYFPPYVNPGVQADPYAISYFNFAENPSTGTRHLVVSGNSAVRGQQTSAFLLNGNTANGIAADIYFTGLEIVGCPGYGAPVYAWHVLEQHFEGSKLQGGLWGVADLPFGANYYNYFIDCQMSGTDAGYQGYFAAVHMDNITFNANGRSTLRLRGCAVNARNLNVSATSNPQYAFCSIYDGIYGGTYQFDNITIDNEGVPYLRAGFYAERHAYTPVNVTVSNCYLGQISYAPIFQLKDKGQGAVYPTAFLDVDTINVDSFYSIVDVDGPGWDVTARNVGTDYGSDMTNQALYAGQPRGKITIASKLPPKFGQSFAGVSRLENKGWVDGQFSDLWVAANGTWGSATPPVWIGRGATQAVPNASIAAYALDHTAIAATLSGHASSSGFLTTYASTQIANALFGTSVPGAATVLTIGATGGSFTLGYGGQTTAPLAWNASPAQVQTALQALSSIGTGNVTVGGNPGGPYTIALAGSLARLAGGALGFSANAASLTGGSQTASLAPSGLPANWYVGLTGFIARKSSQPIFEPPAGSGYARAALANSASGFAAASAGAKANATAVTFPPATTAYGVNAIFLADAPTGGNIWAMINLAQTLNVPAGSSPTINVGGLTFSHVPVGGSFGTLTDYGWGKLFDLLFRGAATVLPTNWYAALSTAALTRSSGGPAEPSGNGYARAAIAAAAAGWAVEPSFSQPGDVQNAAAVAFPAPTGAWGNVVATALCDAPSGGNTWLVAGLTAPISPASGTAPPTFAAGALLLATG